MPRPSPSNWRRSFGKGGMQRPPNVIAERLRSEGCCNVVAHLMSRNAQFYLGPHFLSFLCPQSNMARLSNERKFAARFLWVLPDDRCGLSRSHVVPRAPVFLAGNAVEVFPDAVFPSRQSIASTHSSCLPPRQGICVQQTAYEGVPVHPMFA